MEKRASNDGGEVDENAMAALCKGWYLGEESFKDKLLAMVEGLGKAAKGRSGSEARAYGEKEALRLFKAGWR